MIRNEITTETLQALEAGEGVWIGSTSTARKIAERIPSVAELAELALDGLTLRAAMVESPAS